MVRRAGQKRDLLPLDTGEHQPPRKDLLHVSLLGKLDIVIDVCYYPMRETLGLDRDPEQSPRVYCSSSRSTFSCAAVSATHLFLYLQSLRK